MFWEAISNTWKSVSSDIQTLRIWFKILGCASFLLSTVRPIVRLLVVFNFVERQEWAKIHARRGNMTLGERLVSGLQVVYSFVERHKSGQNTSLNQRSRDTRQAPKVSVLPACHVSSESRATRVFRPTQVAQCKRLSRLYYHNTWESSAIWLAGSNGVLA